jgi:hypothetical protein
MSKKKLHAVDVRIYYKIMIIVAVMTDSTTELGRM